jgi:hypothetical protein
MMDGIWKLISVIRWCNQPDCPNYRRRQYPEEEWRWAPPHGKFGRDIILYIGLRHFYEGLSGPEICRELQENGINIAQRSISNWIHRYRGAYEDKNGGWHPSDWIKAKLQQQGQVVLSIEVFRLAPGDDDYKILGMIGNCLSGEMLSVYRLQRDSEIELLPIELKVRLRKIQKFLSQIGVPAKSLIFNIDEHLNNETLISSALAVFPEIPYQLYSHPK